MVLNNLETNKQIKTIISITSCSLAKKNHKFIEEPAGEEKF